MACDNLRSLLNGDIECYSQSTSASENGKKFSFHNPTNKDVCKVRVDGCLIKDQNIKKCDYFFMVENKAYYLVELKGKSIETAVEQILNTFNIINGKLKKDSSDFTGVIVSSAVPKAANQRFKNIQERVMRDKKLIIKKQQFQYVERI